MADFLRSGKHAKGEVRPIREALTPGDDGGALVLRDSGGSQVAAPAYGDVRQLGPGPPRVGGHPASVRGPTHSAAHDADVVGVEGDVPGDHRQVLLLGLSDKHPIEGIPVMRGKRTRALSVRGRDVEWLET